MTVILQLIQSTGMTSTVLQDAFLVVDSMASAFDANFSPYTSAFLPFLYPTFKAHEDTQLCTVAASNILNRNVKISVSSCFGDIALVIGPGFEPYFETTMGVLREAGSVEPNPLYYDLVDYVGQLHEGILEAYTGIVTGLKSSPKCSQRYLSQKHTL
ncbi:hypothetical protein D9619_011783 [Psilocybe cf. subviscida]|uniref:Importin subunit beta-1/Transportin-1-like TPR repeats domain-containing protein n=1 Tax=Psilocybe cf. subviscida TaxID=2480587 RepID=A0A8H5EVM9_9AGAR|nr:hypothetical protein D9619_011783 [Psilocybe cf. subviscida]